MQRLNRPLVLLLVVLGALLSAPSPAALFGAELDSAPPELEGRDGPVWVIPITGTIDLGLASFVDRAVRDALQANAAAIVVEINTFGGRVDAATEIRDALIGSGIPTVALIRERAWSAGALIALACDWIWMAPGSSMGAAEPRPTDPKIVSALRAEFEAMAERRDRRPDVAGAMVDVEVAIEGLVTAGEILTLTAQKAREYGYAEGISASRRTVLEHLGVDGNLVHEAELNWGERTARFLTDPTVSQILLTLGFLGLLAEVTAPGWGVPGIAGIAALSLFFGARIFIGLVGWEVLGLFGLGMLLLLLEALVIPGFGFAGAGGLIAIFASLYLSFGDGESAIRSIGLALLGTGVGAWLLWKSGRRFGLWRNLVLGSRQSNEEGYVAPLDLRRHQDAKGKSLTTLRPSGTVQIGDERVDAVSEGGYVMAGRPIVVVRVEGTRVVVREVLE